MTTDKVLSDQSRAVLTGLKTRFPSDAQERYAISDALSVITTLQSDNDALRAQVAVLVSCMEEMRPYHRKIVDDTETGKAVLCSLCNAWDDHTHTSMCPYGKLAALPASAAAWLKEREADKARIKELETMMDAIAAAPELK